MGALNIKQFGESAVGSLGLRVRALWKVNGWKLSDAEFFTWQAHLHKADYTYGDLDKAVFDYVHQGGIHKPRFGDLKQFLQPHKHRRIDKKKKQVIQDCDAGPDRHLVDERIKQIQNGQPQLSSEKKSELYDLLTGKANRRVSA